MCGIAGIISTSPLPDALSRMVAQMHHRGPDDSGQHTIMGDDVAIQLGSTRLAIIDLSPAGHMPMVDPATGNWIVYNGEVYNFQALRGELIERGVEFTSQSDTEVVLKAYAMWGTDCVRRFRGMFALAIWDQRQRELFLARDRVGKKPLYFHQGPNGAFLFASEVRTLLATGLVSRHIDPVGLEVYLFNGFSVAPTTLVKGVTSLLPGHWMRVAGNGRIIEQVRYWRLPATRPPGQWTPSQQATAIADVRLALEEAVRLRLVSDVPLGAFLSGGLDSSAIVALMARFGQDVRTFSVSFDEASFDESPYARWVTDRFKTDHTDIRLSQADFVAWLPDALAAMDQPTLDGVNSYCVSRAAREGGLTVALSGLGGDEVFGGYREFSLAPRLAGVNQITSRLPPQLAGLAGAALGRQPFRVPGPLKAVELLDHHGQAQSPLLRMLAAYQTLASLLPYWSREALFGPRSNGAASEVWFGLPRAALPYLTEVGGDDVPLGMVSRFSSLLFLGERTLRDTDMMSMGVSLEVRAPLTDHQFIEQVWAVPSEIRCGGTPYKPFQQEIVRPYLGDDYPYRKKQGFTFPFAGWVHQSPLRPLIERTLAEPRLQTDLGVRPEAVRRLTSAFYQERQPPHWTSVWALFVLFRWCEQHDLALA